MLFSILFDGCISGSYKIWSVGLSVVEESAKMPVGAYLKFLWILNKKSKYANVSFNESSAAAEPGDIFFNFLYSLK